MCIRTYFNSDSDFSPDSMLRFDDDDDGGGGGVLESYSGTRVWHAWYLSCSVLSFRSVPGIHSRERVVVVVMVDCFYISF